MVDVTDATFESAILERSEQVPIVVDLWAPWCGPCRTLGPIIEKVVDETDGQVVLVKVDIDQNPGIAQAFGVQSIPLVVALKGGQPVDGFMGAYPEHTVREFVQALLPSEEQTHLAELIAKGDEPSLWEVLDLDPGNEIAVTALAELMVGEGRSDEALRLLDRIPESAEVRRIAAMARVGPEPEDDYDQRLTALLGQVKADEDARQEYLDLLELMGPDDPRTAGYRKQLTNRLF